MYFLVYEKALADPKICHRETEGIASTAGAGRAVNSSLKETAMKKPLETGTAFSDPARPVRKSFSLPGIFVRVAH